MTNLSTVKEDNDMWDAYFYGFLSGLIVGFIFGIYLLAVISNAWCW